MTEGLAIPGGWSKFCAKLQGQTQLPSVWFMALASKLAAASMMGRSASVTTATIGMGRAGFIEILSSYPVQLSLTASTAADYWDKLNMDILKDYSRASAVKPELNLFVSPAACP
jgi:hypothetical protein